MGTLAKFGFVALTCRVSLIGAARDLLNGRGQGPFRQVRHLQFPE
jgi:hypothetical protein